MSIHDYEGVLVKTTNVVAVGGISLPAWLPALETASIIAAQMVPILSAIWLFVQIWRFIVGKKKDRPNA